MNYRRNQLIWALSHCQSPQPTTEIVKEVHLKVRRLLDADREQVESSGEEFAFHGGEPPGKGGDVAYTEGDAFILQIALKLLHGGFTQRRAVRLVGKLRRKLLNHYDWLIAFTQQDLQGNRDAETWKRDLAKGQFADRPSQLSYLVAPLSLADEDAIVEGQLCRNIEEMKEIVSKFALDFRALLVIELINTAHSLRRWLIEAPEIRRGRPKS